MTKPEMIITVEHVTHGGWDGAGWYFKYDGLISRAFASKQDAIATARAALRKEYRPRFHVPCVYA